jgi:hypothetical protein
MSDPTDANSSHAAGGEFPQWKRTDHIAFDREEIGHLLTLLGACSPNTVRERGLSWDVIERHYDLFTNVAYGPMYDDTPYPAPRKPQRPDSH